MIPAQPTTAFEVVQAEFVFQLPIVHLDSPARVSRFHQAAQARSARPQLRQPVLGRFLFSFRPFDQQPFRYPLGVFLRPPSMRRPDFQPSEARPLRTSAASPPRQLLPRRRRQPSRYRGEILRSRCRSQGRVAPRPSRRCRGRHGVGAGLKRSHSHRFERKHPAGLLTVHRHEGVGWVKEEPAVFARQFSR